MKENQDIQQHILEAMDDSSQENEALDALLDSEEGKEMLCDILDLDEAANRKMGVKPDVKAAWSQFSKHLDDADISEDNGSDISDADISEDEEENKRSRIISIFRYAAACAAIIVFLVVLLMWDNSQSAKKPIAYNQENKEIQAPTEKPTFLDKIKKMATGKVNMVTIVANEQKNVTLPDGTEVCLNARSVLKYPEDFSEEKREIEFCGEGYFKVHHDAAHPFVIKTNTVSTKVLGTEFNLRCYNTEDVHVTLVQGSVEVSLNNEKVKISPNQDAYVESGNVKVQNVNPKDFTSWKDGILYFDNASLRTILQQLGRVYNVSVICRDEHLLNKHFHYMCNLNDSLDEALKLLNECSDINVKLKNNVIVIE